MDEATTEFDYEEHKAKWLKRLADEVEKIEPLLPANFLPNAVEYPQWVRNVKREFSLAMLPAAKLRDANYEITSKRMGALLGHLCGLAVWMQESLVEKDEARDEKKEIHATETDIQNAQKFFVSFQAWYDAVRRLAKRALCSSVDQTYHDMTDFLTGYAEGFARKPKTDRASDFGSTNFEIYHFMLRYWRLVEQMESVRQFHEFLVKVFGASKIGDQKRIEKICQRMELHFRKPGRPKGK
jgi:hypothetical protein